MCALLAGIGPGDEVIVPSYTFVSSANAFALFGATPVFADSDPDTLNIDPDSVASLMSDRTRAIVVVHYGGVPCDMNALCSIASRAGACLIEDNAHGLFGSYQGRPLGSFGALSTLSFHETKNISCGEGGALVVNDPALVDRAEIIWEKGTNRSQFFRGQVDKYTWVDKGSSYLLAEPLAAALCAQLDFADEIQRRRRTAWNGYQEELATWAADQGIRLPHVPGDADHPSHLYWMACPDLTMRSAFIQHMRRQDVHAVFHYQALSASPAGMLLGIAPDGCPVAEAASDTVVRLPLFSDMQPDELERVIEATLSFRGTA
jgi:dTDP-4-amino-4,6-dideoxygalactose transaminase